MALFRKHLAEFYPLINLLYLTFAGMLAVFAAALYLGESPGIGVPLVFAGLVFSIYTFNRFTDIQEDFTNNIAKYAFFAKRQIFYRTGIAFLVLVLIALTAFQKLRLYHIILVSMGLFYSYRLVPWYNPKKGMVFFRLKELPFAKNLIVSSLWGSAVFAIPVLFTDYEIALPRIIYILGLSLFFSTFDNTLFSDIRDVAGDRIAGNKTLPVLWGTRACYGLLALIKFGWLLCIFGLFAARTIDTLHLVFLLVMAAYPFLYICIHQSGKLSPNSIDLLSESDLLLFSAGMALLSLA